MNYLDRFKTSAPFLFSAILICLFLIEPAHASFESSLIAIKTKVTGIILPLLAVIGLAFAGMSFLTGNPNAKQHMTYAVIGCVVGFGAQAIVGFIASTIH